MSLAIAPPTPRQIIDETCRQFQVSTAELLGPAKWEWRVKARRYAAQRMRDELGMSYPEIGKRLGGRHHTTIMGLLGAIRG